MIEETVLAFLENATGIQTFAERPKNPPAEYLLIERTGGGYENYINRATIAVQSYADSLYRAAQMNLRVEKAMRSIDELMNVSKCLLNSSYNWTDTESKKYRYQAVFDIIYMEGD